MIMKAGLTNAKEPEQTPAPRLWARFRGSSRFNASRYRIYQAALFRFCHPRAPKPGVLSRGTLPSPGHGMLHSNPVLAGLPTGRPIS